MADQVVGMLHQVDGKVNDMRNSIESDPESLTDKLVKFALPSIAALLAGKLFQAFWGGLVRKRNGGVDSPEEDQESATDGLLFGVLSAAVIALVSGLSERGSQALIDRRHQRCKQGTLTDNQTGPDNADCVILTTRSCIGRR